MNNYPVELNNWNSTPALRNNSKGGPTCTDQIELLKSILYIFILFLFYSYIYSS